MTGWTVAFTPPASRQLRALPEAVRDRIRRAIDQRLLPDPKGQVIPLTGPLRLYGKFRVGDCRLVCFCEGGVLTVLVVKVDHRQSVYR